MIPIHDSVRSRTFPYVNLAIILVNFVVFFYEIALSQQTILGNVTELDRFIREWGNVPACMFDQLGIDPDLSLRAQQQCNEQPSPVLSIFTAMFMHGSWLHILGNMVFLWVFGDNVEDAMGHVLYALFYLVVGAVAAFSHAAVNAGDLTPAIGASGALSGVMGAYLVLFPGATVSVILPIFFFLPFPVPAVLLMGFWFAMQLFSGVASLGADAVGASDGIAYFAHIGGFVAGLLLVNVFAIHRRRAQPPRPVRTPRDFW